MKFRRFHVMFLSLSLCLRRSLGFVIHPVSGVCTGQGREERWERRTSPTPLFGLGVHVCVCVCVCVRVLCCAASHLCCVGADKTRSGRLPPVRWLAVIMPPTPSVSYFNSSFLFSLLSLYAFFSSVPFFAFSLSLSLLSLLIKQKQFNQVSQQV